MAPVPIGMAEAGPASCENRNNNTTAKLLECVTLAGVREHQQALQTIAERRTGATGSPGSRATTSPSTTS